MITIAEFMPRLEERKFTDVVLEFNFAATYAKESSLYLHAMEESGLGLDGREHIGLSYVGGAGDDDLFEGACNNHDQFHRLEDSQLASSLAARLSQDPILNQRLALILDVSNPAVRNVVRSGVWKYSVDLKRDNYDGTDIEAPYRLLKNLGITGTFTGFKDPDKIFREIYLAEKKKKGLLSFLQ